VLEGLGCGVLVFLGGVAVGVSLGTAVGEAVGVFEGSTMEGWFKIVYAEAPIIMDVRTIAMTKIGSFFMELLFTHLSLIGDAAKRSFSP